MEILSGLIKITLACTITTGAIYLFIKYKNIITAYRGDGRRSGKTETKMERGLIAVRNSVNTRNEMKDAKIKLILSLSLLSLYFFLL